MNEEYEDALNKEFGDCLPDSSPYSSEFWFLLEENIRIKHGGFSNHMFTFHKLRKKFEVERNKTWEKGVTPTWMEEISLGDNPYTYTFGKIFWKTLITIVLLSLLYIVIKGRFEEWHLLNAALAVVFGYDIKNFFAGKDTYFQAGVNSKAESGNSFVRWLGVLFDFIFLGIMCLSLLYSIFPNL